MTTKYRYCFMLLFAGVSVLAGGTGTTGVIRSVSIHEDRNVYAVTHDGQTIRLTESGDCLKAKLSPDSRTVGWLVITPVRPPFPSDEDEEVGVCKKLMVCQNGEILRIIKPGGFIRDWGFWADGAQVVIYTGALHFAGQYILLDLKTGRELASSEDPVTEDSPAWARSLRQE